MKKEPENGQENDAGYIWIAMSKSTLTPAQKKALKLTIDSGGELQIGGMDGQPVRSDVVYNLIKKGYLKYYSGANVQHWISVFHITEAGRKVMDK